MTENDSGRIKQIVLFTETFPFGGVTEKAFVQPEIDALSRNFDKVYILPLIRENGPFLLPENVVVSSCLTKHPSIIEKLFYLFNPITLIRLAQDLPQCGNSVSSVRKSMAYSVYTLFFERKIRKFIKDENIDTDNTVFYTFWFNFLTSSLARIKELNFIVTRAHGYDIYENVSAFLSRKWRREAFSRLTACFPCSENGSFYLRGIYPEFADKIATRYLGSILPPKECNPDSENPEVFTFLSCARLSPEKGVLRQVEFIKEFANRNRDIVIEWIHIGDGPQRALIDDALIDVPGNLKMEFLGAISNENVHCIYQSKHIDLFVLMSYSEGLPISICEAMSYGVPVMATDVGGVSEIVNDESGILLSVSPDKDEFCRRLSESITSLAGKREIARSQWKDKFCAVRLREAFSEELYGIIKEPRTR